MLCALTTSQATTPSILIFMRQNWIYFTYFTEPKLIEDVSNTILSNPCFPISPVLPYLKTSKKNSFQLKLINHSPENWWGRHIFFECWFSSISRFSIRLYELQFSYSFTTNYSKNIRRVCLGWGCFPYARKTFFSC